MSLPITFLTARSITDWRFPAASLGHSRIRASVYNRASYGLIDLHRLIQREKRMVWSIQIDSLIVYLPALADIRWRTWLSCSFDTFTAPLSTAHRPPSDATGAKLSR